jgi:RHS repeat-associated protein
VRWASGALGTDFGFTGQRADAYIKLVEMGVRWYYPQAGRWASPDTIIPDPANPQSLNRYSYVKNNSLKYTDPSGHRWVPYSEGDWISWEINFGSAYHGEWNPAQQARNRSQAEQASSLIVDFTPGVGDVKGLAEAFTGEDLVTGERLGGWRWLGLFGLSELRPVRHLDDAIDVIKAVSKVDVDNLAEFVQRTQQHHWIPREFHTQLRELFPEIGTDLLHFTEPLEEGFHRFLHGQWANETLDLAYNGQIRTWLMRAIEEGSRPTLDEFIQFVGDFRAEYLDLYEQYLTDALDY